MPTLFPQRGKQVSEILQAIKSWQPIRVWRWLTEPHFSVLSASACITIGLLLHKLIKLIF